jgi:hypothetical protein
MVDVVGYEEENMGRLYRAMDSGDVNTVLSYALEESEPPAIRSSANSMLSGTVKKALENGGEKLVRGIIERLEKKPGAEGAIEKLRQVLQESGKAVPDGLMKPVAGSRFSKLAPVSCGPKKQRC